MKILNLAQLLILAAIIVSCNAKSQVEEQTSPMIDGLTEPTDIANAGDGTHRLFILEKPGTIKVYDGNTVNEFLDITEQVYIDHTEMGLLGIAFHPNFDENGYFFLNYTAEEGNEKITRISRFTAADDRQSGMKDSEKVLLEYEQPMGNHNGGALIFGDDGYLYIANGDGGGAGDPEENAQDLMAYKGKILRIDVDKGDPYAIPEDNPFVGEENVREEIFAYGLRNPWKITQDRQTGEIWIADVGQDHLEVINRLEKGGNYGWPVMEGTMCFPPGTECEPLGIEPLYEYSIQDDNCSIIGGYVYRGTEMEDLQGNYIFADYCSGNIWALQEDEDEVTSELLHTVDYMISTFGEDEDGNLYVGDFGNGNIYRLADLVEHEVAARNN
ncbi:PQQ-dependent sugar dehydrogenase [Cytophagaceae bacterium ABcell3]|nr:PQQ-dependent sugar dehydrogenase [Cytophagaceae bacterium ABcell3]